MICFCGSLLKSPVAHHVFSKLSHLWELLLGNDLIGWLSLGLDSGLHLGSDLDVGCISVHLVAKSLFSLILALQRGLDIVIEWSVEWVVNFLTLLSLLVWVGVSGLITLIAVESWVRFQMDISLGTGQLEVSILSWDDPFSIIILIWVPLVTERLLNIIRKKQTYSPYCLVMNLQVMNSRYLIPSMVSYR